MESRLRPARLLPGGRRQNSPAVSAHLVLLAVLAAAGRPAAADDVRNPATVLELPRTEIIATTPLPELGTPLSQVPANVQTVTSRDIDLQRTLDISDVLNQNLGSVSITDTQGSPFQPDVNFRGFTASPVLGTPQGLSVFVDGVRVNEAFGDTVNWDLIPESAISAVTLVPGSNPVFGLNTLGGALNVTTKSGFDYPGTMLQAYDGSFGRHDVEFETGGHGQHLDYFVTGNAFHERGWGEHNPGRVGQLFAKAGYQDDRSDVDLSLNWNNTRLEGNQTLPLSMLGDPRQSYSWPDRQANRMMFLNLKASRFLADRWLLAGNTYFRRLNTSILNSNVNGTFDPALAPGPGNAPTTNAFNEIDQRRPGGSLQLTSLEPIAEHKNSLTIGIGYERGATAFTQFGQQAGAARDTTSNAPLVLTTALRSASRALGLYATDNLALGERLYATLSGRYDAAHATLADQLGAALDGDHRFERFNPAFGLNFVTGPALTTYAAYNEGMRVPTPVELTCADPAAPCSLPNAFSADPALLPVVSKTWETGARGHIGAASSWSAALFRSKLHDDIQFISSGGGATSAGYFQNVGQTRRQGVELGAASRAGPVSVSLHYSYVDATFRSPLVLNSPSNSTAAPLSCPTCTDIRVQPGDRIPGIAHHLLKVRTTYAPDERALVGVELIAQSSQYARGDENNRDANGAVPGYALVNFDGHYRFAAGWELYAKVGNLFNRRYATYGVLGQNVFTAAGNTFDATGASWRNEQFRTVGAARGAWLGIAYRIGVPASGDDS